MTHVDWFFSNIAPQTAKVVLVHGCLGELSGVASCPWHRGPTICSCLRTHFLSSSVSLYLEGSGYPVGGRIYSSAGRLLTQTLDFPTVHTLCPICHYPVCICSWLYPSIVGGYALPWTIMDSTFFFRYYTRPHSILPL